MPSVCVITRRWLNMAEIKRYIDQQKQIIIYYEKAVAPKPKEAPAPKKK